MKKFTFKTIKPTGRYKSFSSPDHEIKLNGVRVGSINNSPNHIITLMVLKKDINEDGNPNCVFKNVRLTVKNDTLQGAKDYLNNNFQRVMNLGIYIRTF